MSAFSLSRRGAQELAALQPTICVGDFPRSQPGLTICLASSGRQLGYCEYVDASTPPDQRRNVILLPGIPGTRLFTHPIVQQLGFVPTWRLVVLERPGIGLSDPAPLPYTYTDFVADFREFCAQLGLTRVSVIGFSAGTPFATAIACVQPQFPGSSSGGNSLQQPPAPPLPPLPPAATPGAPPAVSPASASASARSSDGGGYRSDVAMAAIGPSAQPKPNPSPQGGEDAAAAPLNKPLTPHARATQDDAPPCPSGPQQLLLGARGPGSAPGPRPEPVSNPTGEGYGGQGAGGLVWAGEEGAAGVDSGGKAAAAPLEAETGTAALVVDGVALVSAIGPPDTPNKRGGMALLFQLGYWACAKAPWLVGWMVRSQAAAMRKRPLHTLRQDFAQYSSRADVAAMRRPEVERMFLESAMELYGRGQEDAVLRENILFAGRPWGFDLAGCSTRVAIWQGGQDRGCTPAMATHLAAVMGPRATVTVLPDQGHMLYFDRWEEIVSWINGLTPAQA